MLSLLGSISLRIGGFSIAVLLVILRLTFGPQMGGRRRLYAICRAVYFYWRSVYRHGITR